MSARAETVHVTVRDYGIGIGAEDQQRLFTEFFRAKAARESGIPGSGLGLAICARVIHALGGTIDVRSRPGEGTIFTVALPLRHGDHSAADHHGA
jgi:signal transduction histidine kinase